jgi:hypothetical protein
MSKINKNKSKILVINSLTVLIKSKTNNGVTNDNMSNFCAIVIELEAKNLPSHNQGHWSPLKIHTFLLYLVKVVTNK